MLHGTGNELLCAKERKYTDDKRTAFCRDRAHSEIETKDIFEPRKWAVFTLNVLR